MERVLFVLARAEDLVEVAGTVATLRGRGGAASAVVGVRGREAEVGAAAARLGLTDIRWLGDADARWPGRPPRRYTRAESDAQTGWLESLEAADAGEVAADVAATIDRVKPDAVVVIGETGGIPDRSRIQHATRLAAEVLEVPWFTVEGPAARGGMRVDVTAAGPARASAAAALGMPAPSGTIERFRRQRAGGLRFEDTSVASRVVSCLVAVVLGAAAGALLTAVHQATAQVGGVPAPWGLIAAALVTTGLLAGLRIVFGTRLVAGCAAAALIAASALFSLQTGGGTLFVPANPVGYIWTFAPVVIGALVVAWPGPRSGRTTRSAEVGSMP